MSKNFGILIFPQMAPMQNDSLLKFWATAGAKVQPTLQREKSEADCNCVILLDKEAC